MELFSTVPLLIIDDLGMRKLPTTAAEDLLEIVMRRYERASTLLTSNRPVEDWGNYSATARPSPQCSIDCCITDTCSNAAPAVCAQKLTCRQRIRRSKTTLSRPFSLAGFDLIAVGRF